MPILRTGKLISAGSWPRTDAKVVKVEVDLNKKNVLYVNVCIDKSTFRSLIDTGSMISIISKQIYDNLKKRDHHSTPSEMTAHSVTGQTLNLYGIFNTGLEIDNKEFSVSMYIAGISGLECLIGLLAEY